MLAEFAGYEDVDLNALLPFAGLLLGVLFGIVAQASRFCLRSAVVQSGSQGLSPMTGAYALALLAAIGGVQMLAYMEMVDLGETRFVSDTLPLGALVLGGVMFGAGMVLTRGCASRLTVLTAQGNLRALTVLTIFAITAYASLRGLLAAPRIAFTDATALTIATEHSILPVAGAFALVALLALIVWRSGVGMWLALAGATVGIVIVGGWFATGVLLADSFDPRPAESLAFTSGASDALFYGMASTALEPGFGSAMVGGVLIGAFLSALVRRELRLESFDGPDQTVRYLGGAVLMGVGGVLAGGCTIGAGLTGLSTLTVAPLIAIVAIIGGAAATHAILGRDEIGVSMVPAE